MLLFSVAFRSRLFPDLFLFFLDLFFLIQSDIAIRVG
jgi:hypothetical protein